MFEAMVEVRPNMRFFEPTTLGSIFSPQNNKKHGLIIFIQLFYDNFCDNHLSFY